MSVKQRESRPRFSKSGVNLRSPDMHDVTKRAREIAREKPSVLKRGRSREGGYQQFPVHGGFLRRWVDATFFTCSGVLLRKVLHYEIGKNEWQLSSLRTLLVLSIKGSRAPMSPLQCWYQEVRQAFEGAVAVWRLGKKEGLRGE